MSTQDTDLVQVLVPRHRVLDVYRLLGEPSVPSPAAQPPQMSNGDNGGLPDDWSASLIRRMYTESPKAMQALLDTLAENTGEVVTANELIDVLSRVCGKKANSAALGGTLGAFGRRVSNRYKQEEWPFEAWWDADSRQVHYRMSPAVAAVIRNA
jgi:hypothetical protein